MYLADYSDGVLYVLAVLLLVALAVIIDRSWSLRSTLIHGQSIIRGRARRAATPGGEFAGGGAAGYRRAAPWQLQL
jgi:biopolymer transport protein ExbB